MTERHSLQRAEAFPGESRKSAGLSAASAADSVDGVAIGVSADEEIEAKLANLVRAEDDRA